MKMARPPGYWMHETSGVLRPAVEAYLAGGEMTDEQLAVMRAYCRQWVMSDIWSPYATRKDRCDLEVLRAAVDMLVSRPLLAIWLARAEAFGMDPL